MQMTLRTNLVAKEYNQWILKNEIEGLPVKCPMCFRHTKFRKHGFYQRTSITLEEVILIYVRRYLCIKCGRTLSFLPQFCHPRFQYGIISIFLYLSKILTNTSVSAESVILKLRCTYKHLEIGRQHIRFYVQRLRANRLKLEMTVRDIDKGYSLRWHKKSGNDGELIEFIYRYILTPQSRKISFNRTPLIPALSKESIS